ncbi:MAG: lasso peptide biosynthesis B2 protein [Myxococcales bacterium]|nr:lasso peptide biosynthesis B2 protein [Myxococcales bacterium]
MSLVLHARYVVARAAITRDFSRVALDALLARSRASSASQKHIVSVGRLAAVISRCEAFFTRTRLLPDTCLYRALARFAVLSAHGADPTFVMALPSDGSNEGHAWIELDGEPWLDDEDLSSMKVTFCYPPARTFANPAQRRAP